MLRQTVPESLEHKALRLWKLIHEHSRLSRAELAALTGFSHFLVSRLCDDLLRNGYISEVGAGESTGGRRPRILAVPPGLGRIVGLHVGTVNARVVVTDIAGTVMAFLKAPSLAQSGPDAALSHLIDFVAKAIAQAGVRMEELLGIGVGISGILDRRTGTMLSWPKVPSWKNVPVLSAIAARFPVPVKLEDTPRAMALAERRFGRARNESEFLYVMIGAGVGAALILGGRPYTGKDGFAGEFGHIATDPNGLVCDCGNRGCVETRVSAWALVHKAREALSQGLRSELWRLCAGDPQRISVELIAQAADAGDRFALRLVEEAGVSLGEAMVCLVNLLNPELVVLGGGVVAALGRRLLDPASRIVRERALAQAVNSLRIELSSLQEADWALGASLLVAEDAMTRAFLSWNKNATGKRRRRLAGRVPV
jgi:predicted NBD/HSP70 family sugar kinase